MTRDIASQTLAALQENAQVIRGLVWIEPKSRVDGSVQGVGLWTGVASQTFSIGGASRTYVGAGSALDLGSIIYETGVQVRQHTIILSGISATFELLARTYDALKAPVEIHRAHYDPATRALVAEPERLFKGECRSLSIPRPEPGGTAEAQMGLLSNAHTLTLKVPVKRSDASQRLRSASDDGRLYADSTGTYYWGIDAP